MKARRSTAVAWTNCWLCRRSPAYELTATLLIERPLKDRDVQARRHRRQPQNDSRHVDQMTAVSAPRLRECRVEFTFRVCADATLAAPRIRASFAAWLAPSLCSFISRMGLFIYRHDLPPATY
jgi:hypothetical protein